MPRDYTLYLADIEAACKKILEFTSNSTIETLRSDAMRADAVMMNLLIIGEAVKNVPDDIKHRQPEVSWKKITGLRDIIVHAYFAINWTIIWDIVQNHIPSLLEAIQKLLRESDQPC